MWLLDDLKVSLLPFCCVWMLNLGSLGMGWVKRGENGGAECIKSVTAMLIVVSDVNIKNQISLLDSELQLIHWCNSQCWMKTIQLLDVANADMASY